MAGQATVRIEVHGAGAIGRALRVLRETDAPFLRGAMDESGHILQRNVQSRARGSIGGTVHFAGVQGTGGGLRAKITVSHPGAKAMEFGRKTYYRGFRNRRQKATGTPFRASPGQRAAPFVGIRGGGHAVGASEAPIKQKIVTAIEREWDRITSGPD